MKKIIFSLIAVAFLALPAVSFADETATSTVSITSSGGYMNVCEYVKAYDNTPCVNSTEHQSRFIFDQAYHNYVIGHWFATWRVTWD